MRGAEAIDDVGIFAAPDGSAWAELAAGGSRVEVPLGASPSPLAAAAAIAWGGWEPAGVDAEEVRDFLLRAGCEPPQPSAGLYRKQPAAREAAATERSVAMQDKQTNGDAFYHLKVSSSLIDVREPRADRNGVVRQRGFLTIPKGTKVNGVDMTGWKVNVFIQDFNIQDKLMGEPTNLSFKKDEIIKAWRRNDAGAIEERPMPSGAFVKAMSEGRRAYLERMEEKAKEARAQEAERAAEPEPRKPAGSLVERLASSMDRLERACSDGSQALAGGAPTQGTPPVRQG